MKTTTQPLVRGRKAISFRRFIHRNISTGPPNRLLQQARQLAEQQPVPYSSEALRQDLQRVRDAWADC